MNCEIDLNGVWSLASFPASSLIPRLGMRLGVWSQGSYHLPLLLLFWLLLSLLLSSHESNELLLNLLCLIECLLVLPNCSQGIPNLCA